MGESSPVKTRLSLTNSTRTPLRVRPWTRARRSSRFRASRSMLCTTTVSPSRANRSSSMSSGRVVSLPEALSVKTGSRTWPSSWRFSFWSSVLTRTYPIRCPATVASNPRTVRLSSRPVSEESQDATASFVRLECASLGGFPSTNPRYFGPDECASTKTALRGSW